jgi:hypothetical protein
MKNVLARCAILISQSTRVIPPRLVDYLSCRSIIGGRTVGSMRMHAVVVDAIRSRLRAYIKEIPTPPPQQQGHRTKSTYGSGNCVDNRCRRPRIRWAGSRWQQLWNASAYSIGLERSGISAILADFCTRALRISVTIAGLCTR